MVIQLKLWVFLHNHQYGMYTNESVEPTKLCMFGGVNPVVKNDMTERPRPRPSHPLKTRWKKHPRIETSIFFSHVGSHQALGPYASPECLQVVPWWFQTDSNSLRRIFSKLTGWKCHGNCHGGCRVNLATSMRPQWSFLQLTSIVRLDIPSTQSLVISQVLNQFCYVAWYSLLEPLTLESKYSSTS